jgi:putative FmdB family regulatory protein
MPVYDFKCPKCGSFATRTQSITAPTPKVKCVCKTQMVKVIHSPAVSFRGTGWGREAR